MASLDSILNFAIPAILILVAFGFIYTKFLKPWVVPWVISFWEWIQGKEMPTIHRKKEIVYSDD